MYTSTTRAVSVYICVHTYMYTRLVLAFARHSVAAVAHSCDVSLDIGWCQRIKSEFKFEYAYLEDELGGVEA